MLVRMTLPLSAAHSPATLTPAADPTRDASSSESPRPSRRYWTPEDKAECLALFAESGLSAAAFCREMNISEATFAFWRRQARAAALESPGAPEAGDDVGDEVADAPVESPASVRSGPSRFAAVQLVAATPASTPPPAPRALPSARELGLVLRWPNGVTAELTGLDVATTSALVRELASSWAPTAMTGA
jgi:transposase-like protein